MSQVMTVRNVGMVAVAFLVPVTVLVAQRGTDPPTQVVVRTEGELTSAVKAAVAATPDLSLTEVKNTTEYLINIVHRGRPGNAISHVDYHESHYIMEGGGMLVTGGTLVQRAGMTVIEGGQSQAVRKGD